MQFTHATRQNLHRLILLRGVVMFSLGLVLLILWQAGIPLAFARLTVCLAALGVLNVIAWWWLKAYAHISQRALFAQLMGDMAVLSVLFYLSGGYSNPFIWMYLIPITVAAVALRALFAWLVALLGVVSYTVLMFVHVPLSHLHMHVNASTRLDIHLVGMWLGFVVCALIIAVFISRIGQNLREYDQKMAAAREQTLESERMLALGTLATSAAHALGTPLATMAVLGKELANDLQAQHFKNQPEALSQLAVLRTQIDRCKEILSGITQAAGQSRAEAGQGVLLLDFLQETLEKWRDTRPATALQVNIAQQLFNPRIILDRTLAQAVHNLLDNAADAAPEQVVFEAKWDEKTLHLSIQDFGKGLSAQAQQHIGTPFFSAKNTEGQGMGLGVYLTQITLARYDGVLQYQTHTQGGTLALIKLPLNKLICNI